MTHLTPSQIQSNRDDGDLVLDGVLRLDEGAQLRRLWRACPRLAAHLP